MFLALLLLFAWCVLLCKSPAVSLCLALGAGVVGLLALLAAIFLLARRRRQHHGRGSSSSKQHAASLLNGSRDGSRCSSHLQQDPPQADRSVRGTLQGEAGAQLLPQQSGDRLSSFDNPAASFGRDGLTLGECTGGYQTNCQCHALFVLQG